MDGHAFQRRLDRLRSEGKIREWSAKGMIQTEDGFGIWYIIDGKNYAPSKAEIRKRPRITRTSERRSVLPCGSEFWDQAWADAQLCGRSLAIRVMG